MPRLPIWEIRPCSCLNVVNTLLLFDRYIGDSCGSPLRLAPSSLTANPTDGTFVPWVPLADISSPAITTMWCFDEEEKRVVHSGGKFLWAYTDSTDEGNWVDLHGKKNEATR